LRVADSNAHGKSFGNANCDSNRDANCHSDSCGFGNANGYCNCHSDSCGFGNANGYCNCNSDCCGFGNANGYCHCYGYSDGDCSAEVDADTTASPNAAAKGAIGKLIIVTNR
jgi:hypothetical protein